MAKLMRYDFPGNVWDLENIIEQAFVLCRGGLIEVNHLPPELRPSPDFGFGDTEPMNLAAMEKHLVTLVLKRSNGNRKKAARELGIDTSTLFRKMKAFYIEPPTSDGRRN